MEVTQQEPEATKKSKAKVATKRETVDEKEEEREKMKKRAPIKVRRAFKLSLSAVAAPPPNKIPHLFGNRKKAAEKVVYGWRNSRDKQKSNE